MRRQEAHWGCQGQTEDVVPMEVEEEEEVP